MNFFCKHKFLIVTLFICLLFDFSFAQSDRKLKLEAKNAMLQKDWFSASQYYYRLYFRDSSELELQYNYAEASRLNFDNDVALRLYQKVLRTEDADLKYPLCYYWIGELYKQKANYKEAKKWFTKASKIKRTKKFEYDYYNPKSKLEIEACDLALVLIKTPVIPKPKHLDTNINSKVSEYAAFEFDSSLYFSSLRSTGKKDANEVNLNKIYKSEQINSKWQKPKMLDTTINTALQHNANTCFNSDYKLMIVSRCRAKNASEYICELFSCKYDNNRFSELVKLPEPINLKNYSTTQPCFGKLGDKVVLFFTSNRPGGQGLNDIWYSVYENGKFETPVNCGKNINTPDDDITPWYVPERKTLYFSSTYHKGLGGFDIFKSVYNDTTFLVPQNAGYPINSSYNDVYYSVNKARNKAYLSSNRVGSYFEEKLNCCNDIYSFEIEPLTLPVQPLDTLKLLKNQMTLLVPLTLYFHNDEPDPKTKNITTTRNYEATYNDYKKLVPDYLNQYPSGLFNSEKTGAINRVVNFFADSVDAGMNDLLKFADLLEKVLLKNETVKITMKGYCSPLASTDYNVNLAKRRISSLRNFFSEYKNGYFKTYIDEKTEGKGKIIFEDVDIGELTVSKVSDDLKDKRNSVYSPFAAQERKIQIIAVSFGVQ